MKPHLRVALVATLVPLASCGETPVVFSDAPTVEGEILAAGMWIPDGIAVIGEDEFLFADRGGDVFHYKDGSARPLNGIPASRTSGIYGGVLDLSLHPDFSTNRRVYMSYNDASWGLAVSHFELSDGRAENVTTVFRSDDFSIGSRIEWQDESHFFLSLGIGGDPFPDPGPQDLSMDVGKIHRLAADGSIPGDNPIFPGATGPTSVWSYGHRNPQGMYYDDVEDRLYATEHGPLGGDELNLVVSGRNYGWPVFSFGLNYDQSAVSDVTADEAFLTTEEPLAFWGPNDRVAPAGLAYVETGPLSVGHGTFLIGALNPRNLLRFDPTDGSTSVLIRGVGRVRDIAQLPGGDILLALDAGSPTAEDEGRILRLSSTPTR